MPVRIQASVQSGKAILRFRNALEDQVTVTSLVASSEDGEERWIPLLTDPITLRPGQIHSADINDSVRSLFSTPESAELEKRRFRIRILLAPEHLRQPSIADCTVSFHHNQCTEFICV